MPPLMHSVPQSGALQVDAVHYIHNNILMHYHHLLAHNGNQQMTEDVYIFEEEE